MNSLLESGMKTRDNGKKNEAHERERAEKYIQKRKLDLMSKFTNLSKNSKKLMS